MARLLRKALENSDSSPDPATQASIIMKGPLADVYSKALQVAFDKENPAIPEDDTVKAVLESQQIDVAIMEKMAKLMGANEPPPTDNFQTVYGVSKDGITDEVIVDVTNELVSQATATGNRDRSDDFVLIVDATLPGGEVAEKFEPLATALETMVQAHGGKVYHSLSEYTSQF